MSKAKKYGTQADLARLIGCNRSQVTRALASGRIKKSRNGLIDLEQAVIDWASSRSDSRAGEGTPDNNPKPKAKPAPRKSRRPLPAVGDVADVPDYDDVDDMPEDDDEGGPSSPSLTEAKTKKEIVITERQKIKLKYERGVSIDRDDALLVYVSILGGVKTGILTLPPRYAQGAMKVIDKLLAEHGVKIESARRASLIAEISAFATKEANYVLEQVRTNMTKADEETRKIAEKYVKKKPAPRKR